MLQLRAVIGSDIEHGFRYAALHVTSIDFGCSLRKVVAQRASDSRKVRVIAEQDFFFNGEIELRCFASSAVNDA